MMMALALAGLAAGAGIATVIARSILHAMKNMSP